MSGLPSMGVVVGLGSRVLVTFGVAAVLLLGGGVPAYADGEDDAQAVFCLGKGRGDLQDAAKALGVGIPAGIDEWRKAKPSEFERVCSALYGSEKAPSPGWFSQALPFLTGLFGAVLAYAATAWRDRITRGRQQGADLRAALEEFETAASGFLTDYVGAKSEPAVQASRAKLISQLTVVKSEHPGWSRVRSLLDDLHDGPLGERLTARAGQGDEAKSKDARSREKLKELRDEVHLVANAVARPARQHPAMSPRTR